MYPMVEYEIGTRTELEALRAEARARRARARAKANAQVTAAVAPQIEIAIRDAEPGDLPALMRLAELDSRPLPGGELLVIEAAGRIRAAFSVDEDAMIADPFVATGELQALLRLRADQLKRESRRTRTGLLNALHLRPRGI